MLVATLLSALFCCSPHFALAIFSSCLLFFLFALLPSSHFADVPLFVLDISPCHVCYYSLLHTCYFSFLCLLLFFFTFVTSISFVLAIVSQFHTCCYSPFHASCFFFAFATTPSLCLLLLPSLRLLMLLILIILFGMLGYPMDISVDPDICPYWNSTFFLISLQKWFYI